MDPEKITIATFAGLLLASQIWVVRFILVRIETVIRDNTQAIRELLKEVTAHGIK